MANFCTKCGRPLPENGICSFCAGSGDPVMNQGQPSHQQTPTYEQQQAFQAPPHMQGQPQPDQQQGFQAPPHMQGQPQPNQQQGFQAPPHMQGQPQPNQQQGFQTPPYMQGQPQPNQQQGGYYNPYNGNMPNGGEWFNNVANPFIRKAQNIFSELPSILKAPATHTKKLAASGNVMIGLGYVLAKTVLSFIIALVTLLVLRSNLGMASEYIKIPYLQTILVTLILTAGLDCLQALFLNLFTNVFHGKTSFEATITIVGSRVLYECFVLVATAVLFLILGAGVAAVVFSLGASLVVFIEYAAYAETIDLASDKKVYAFIIAKACTTVISMVILYIFVTTVITSVFGSAMGILNLF